MSAHRSLLVLARGAAARAYEQDAGSVDELAASIDLARTLAAVPSWSADSDATFLLRAGPEPCLAVLGTFSDEARLRLVALSQHLAHGHARLIDYRQAEQDCERLAAQLRDAFGSSALREFGFTALPRGGLIVLGMLSYVAGLSKSQLVPPPAPDRPLVVVDDIALTGHRFGEFVSRCDHPELVFATLYSPAPLRLAIRDREPRVRACLSAHDLLDLAPGAFGEECEPWRRRMLERLPPPRYWVGQPEFVSFAWSEPEWGFWNPETGKMESGWPLSSAAATLRGRSGETPELPIRIVPPGRGPLRPAPHTLFLEGEEGVLVVDTRHTQVLMLQGVAAAIWRGIVEHGNEAGVTAALLESYDVAAETLSRDVRAFVEDCTARGLLCRDSAGAAAL